MSKSVPFAQAWIAWALFKITRNPRWLLVLDPDTIERAHKDALMSKFRPPHRDG